MLAVPFELVIVLRGYQPCFRSGMSAQAVSWKMCCFIDCQIVTDGEAVHARLCGVCPALCQGVVVEWVNELEAFNRHHVSEECLGILLAVNLEHKPAHRSRILHPSG